MMEPNDDIVGQKITNVVKTSMGVYEIRLTNGMIITSSGEFMIHDGGINWLIKKWVTHENGKRIRLDQPGGTNAAG